MQEFKQPRPAARPCPASENAGSATGTRRIRAGQLPSPSC